MDKRKGQGKEQMSKKDTVTKAFMRENTVFADAFNYLIFNGKKVIQPEQLQELDTTELVQLIAKGKNNKNESVQKYRDILKATVIMEDENADYLLLGIENQTEIHYAMPVRNMIYDALQYGNPVAAIAAQNVKEKKAPKGYKLDERIYLLYTSAHRPLHLLLWSIRQILICRFGTDEKRKTTLSHLLCSRCV